MRLPSNLTSSKKARKSSSEDGEIPFLTSSSSISPPLKYITPFAKFPFLPLANRRFTNPKNM